MSAPSSAEFLTPGSLELRSVELRLQRCPGALLPQLLAALALHGRPLRWAITGVCGDGLTLEAVVIGPSGRP
ncbi:hypothetical protein IQ216_05405 [Cyanobium sp. LEGE 06143]|uniref:hypothetical protein n=1 Tax=Cyanobium sp. LEGE 06143 TaxID=945727 RepID=UPI0018800DAD|nr:hypothetical protein [Cyanobium sp. LEGE 06143]MBE9172541.1 hypothetical protein [Cyanobium sp. LEGE 06143]